MVNAQLEFLLLLLSLLFFIIIIIVINTFITLSLL